MLSYNELKPGILFLLDGQPYEILESEFLRMQQRKPVMKTKIRNLISGKIVDRSFQPSDTFEEAEVERMKAQFLYSRGRVNVPYGQIPEARFSDVEFWFCELNNPKNRFMLKLENVGDNVAKFLKPDMEIAAIKFNDKILNIDLPIKVDYKVIEAPPAIRGDTAQGGTKVVVIETGAKINVPLFINEGDIIRINTQTGQYTERIEKG